MSRLPESRSGGYMEGVADIDKPVLESAESSAKYWLTGAREIEDRSEAILAAEQAANVWKNAAYHFARLWSKAPVSETRATVGEGPIHRVTYALSDIERWKANSARYEWLADKVIAPDYGDNDSKPRRKGYYIEHCKGTDKIYGESLDAAIDEMIALDAKYAANRQKGAE